MQSLSWRRSSKVHLCRMFGFYLVKKNFMSEKNGKNAAEIWKLPRKGLLGWFKVHQRGGVGLYKRFRARCPIVYLRLSDSMRCPCKCSCITPPPPPKPPTLPHTHSLFFLRISEMPPTKVYISGRMRTKDLYTHFFKREAHMWLKINPLFNSS